MSLALSTLIYEWRRYMAAIVALAFCGMLVLAFTGLFMGIVASFSAIFGNTPADLVVLNGQSQSWFGGGDMPSRVVPQVFQNPEVVEAREMALGNGQFSTWPKTAPGEKSKPGEDRRNWSLVITIDPVKGALTVPSDFSDATITALQEPYAVAVDRSTLGQLGVKQGDKAKINGHTVYVRAVITGYPSSGQVMIFMSRQTGRLLGVISGDPQRVNNLLVKVRDPSKVREIAEQINAIGKDQFKAWPRTDLEAANQKQFLTRGGLIAIILIFLLIFGG
ncbi:MAG: ABC transporter permease, partial [Asticcacaulis sp.]